MDTQQDLGKVLYAAEGHIARITLNWPEKANAQSSEMVWNLDAALDLAEKDYDIKVVILRANGKGFCSGHQMSGPDAYPEFGRSQAATDSNWLGSRELFLFPTLRFF
ncbi:MAG: enoyl-CoA hydratase-related protein, partial [Actinomycetota bacterium]|nr:enoyl-CoA hydratase-related protein [Actinomycetota bacterium]